MSRRCGSRAGRYMSDEEQRVDGDMEVVTPELGKTTSIIEQCF